MSDTVKGTSNLNPAKTGAKPMSGLDKEAITVTSPGEDRDSDNASKSNWLDEKRSQKSPAGKAGARR